MATGQIKKVVSDRGFGFISGTGMKDVFFHCSVVRNTEFDDLKVGDVVTYDFSPSDNGPKATRVELVGR